MTKPAGVDVHAHFFISARATGLSLKDQRRVVRDNATRMLSLG